MYAIVVWMQEETLFPSVIGPYESDLVFDDANLLRAKCHKVQVVNITTPDQSSTLGFLQEASQRGRT